MDNQPADRAIGDGEDDAPIQPASEAAPAAVFDVVGMGDLRARMLEGAAPRVDAPATEPPSDVIKRIAVSVPSPRDSGPVDSAETESAGATPAGETLALPAAGGSTASTAEDGSSFSLDEVFTAQEQRQRKGVQTQLPWWLIATVAICVIAVLVAWLFLSREPDGVDPTGSSVRPEPVVASSVVRFQPGGPLTASEPIAFPRPVSTLSLSVPDRSGVDGLSAFEPVISDLVVLVDDLPPQAVAEVLEAGDTVTVDLAEPTRTVTLDYVARGVVKRSVPSTEGRASVLVTPLTVDTAGAERGRLSIMGVNVLNSGCFSAAGATSCGEQTAAGWEVKAPAMLRSDDVLAQVDMLNGSP